MPRYRSHTVEVHLAERHEEDEEHKQGNYLVEKRRKESGGTIECRRQGKEQINCDTCSHADRQRPVFQKPYYSILFLHCFAKIVQIERNAKGNLDFLFISEMQPIFGEAKVANK